MYRGAWRATAHGIAELDTIRHNLATKKQHSKNRYPKDLWTPWHHFPSYQHLPLTSESQKKMTPCPPDHLGFPRNLLSRQPALQIPHPNGSQSPGDTEERRMFSPWVVPDGKAPVPLPWRAFCSLSFSDSSSVKGKPSTPRKHKVFACSLCGLLQLICSAWAETLERSHLCSRKTR